MILHIQRDDGGALFLHAHGGAEEAIDCRVACEKAGQRVSPDRVVRRAPSPQAIELMEQLIDDTAVLVKP